MEKSEINPQPTPTPEMENTPIDNFLPKHHRIRSIFLLLAILLLIYPVITTIKILTNPNYFKPYPPVPNLTPSPITPIPSLNPITDWQTYIDPKYPYQISYPSNWKPELLEDDKNNNFITYRENNGDLAAYIKIEPNFSTNKKPVEQWINDEINEYQKICIDEQGGCGGGGVHYFVAKRTVGNVLAYKTKWTASGYLSGFYITYIIPHDKTNYAITIESEVENPISEDNFDETGSKYADYYQEILSTFQFPDQPTPTLDTANWKAYTNTKYRYQFNYPDYWEIWSVDNSIDYPPLTPTPFPGTGNNVLFGFEKRNPDGSTSKQEQMYTFAIDNPKQLKLKDYFINEKWEKEWLKLIEYTTVNNYEAVNLQFSGLPSGYYINSGKYIVNLRFSYDEVNDKFVVPPQQTFDQILSTFRFLDPPTPTLQSLCESATGSRWLSEYNECEYIDSQTCTQLLKGTFNDCVSACRHNPKAEMCTQNCVPVCIVK